MLPFLMVNSKNMTDKQPAKRSRRVPTETVGEVLGIDEGNALLDRAAQTHALKAAFDEVHEMLMENADSDYTLNDVLELPATVTNVRKVEHLLHVADAQAKLIVAAGQMIRKDLFPKCVIAKAEAHARALKEQERRRRKQEREEKRGGSTKKRKMNDTPPALLVADDAGMGVDSADDDGLMGDGIEIDETIKVDEGNTAA